jgi:prevent-host-death family protein
MDKFLTATEARQRFLKLVAEVKEGERVIITHRGKPAAAVIDFEQLQLLTELAGLWQNPKSLDHIRASHEDLRAGRVYPLKGVPTVKRLINLARKKGLHKRARG